MKKMTLPLAVVAFMLIPTMLLAQPPRPPRGQMPQARAQVAAPPARPTMQVHNPPRPVVVQNQYAHPQHRPPVVVHPHQYPYPAYYPPVVQPRVVVAAPVMPAPVIAAPVVIPYNYYPPVSSGFSLTIGGRNGVFSIGTGY